MAMPEAGNNYLILVDKVGALDRLTVKVEVGSGVFADDSRPLNALRDRICAKLQTSISIKRAWSSTSRGYSGLRGESEASHRRKI